MLASPLHHVRYDEVKLYRLYRTLPNVACATFRKAICSSYQIVFLFNFRNLYSRTTFVSFDPIFMWRDDCSLTKLHWMVGEASGTGPCPPAFASRAHLSSQTCLELSMYLPRVSFISSSIIPTLARILLSQRSNVSRGMDRLPIIQLSNAH
ncbi:hypothetical protein BDP81DRAFT_423514 [Colletotrichum phormii]|uniref:Uncharacterized protein n=1 Tax=Colletotrichum phormii TaxID=359342 RepID=A0AAJ0EHD8_9PEZI|nr:uncharacterized protein BDP81DRAFT_423514 [Colletotrichum phormii]KAK1639128.1 hypothetical protein BDP81DRAFT_423514 [Colletotrichum phormii]